MSGSGELNRLIAELRAHIANPRQGLPQEVFYLVSELTPLVNVDLLIRNAAGQTLLTWRADQFYGPGWHVPGGILRFKESFAQRIREVARLELGAQVEFDPSPLWVREITAPNRDVRGHFISHLHACRLTTPPATELKFSRSVPKHGQWEWHDTCPQNLIAAHEVYRAYIDGTLPA